jgi:hypothetical protein
MERSPDGILCSECSDDLAIPDLQPAIRIGVQRLRGMAAGVELAAERSDDALLQMVASAFEAEAGRKPVLALGMTYEEAFDALKGALARANQSAYLQPDLSGLAPIDPPPEPPAQLWSGLEIVDMRATGEATGGEFAAGRDADAPPMRAPNTRPKRGHSTRRPRRRRE